MSLYKKELNSLKALQKEKRRLQGLAHADRPDSWFTKETLLGFPSSDNDVEAEAGLGNKWLGYLEWLWQSPAGSLILSKLTGSVKKGKKGAVPQIFKILGRLSTDILKWNAVLLVIRTGFNMFRKKDRS